MEEDPYEAIYRMSRIDGHRFRNRAAGGGSHPKAASKGRAKQVPSAKACPASTSRTSGIVPGPGRGKRRAPAQVQVHRAVAASGIVPSQHLKGKRMPYSLSERYELGTGVLEEEHFLANQNAAMPKGWLSDWAKAVCPHLKDNVAGLRCFVKLLSKWKRQVSTGELVLPHTPGKAQLGSGHSGFAVSNTRWSKRKRKECEGSKAFCQPLRQELFDWFIDYVKTTRARVGSRKLLNQAQIYKNELDLYYEEEIRCGRIDATAKPLMPKLEDAAGLSWLSRWRREYGITFRTVNLRFKCSRRVLLSRLAIFWKNVLYIRWLHHFLYVEPLDGRIVDVTGSAPRLCFENSDQKPLWFNTAALEKTLALRGSPRVIVKEAVNATRQRFTVQTRVSHPAMPSDGKDLAVLFKANSGVKIREELENVLPANCLLQFGPKGSYRFEQTLEYYEWVVSPRIPVEALPDAPPPPLAAGTAPGRRPQDFVVYMADWFKPNLDLRLQNFLHDQGHLLLLLPGLTTGHVQVNDTHAHAPFSKSYKRLETLDNQFDNELNKPMPDVSRATVLTRACAAWVDIKDRVVLSHGFVSNGIANALDGTEDDNLSPDVKPFWFDPEVNMPLWRDRIMAEVKAKVQSGQLREMHDYVNLLLENPHCRFSEEGHECFKIFGDSAAAEVEAEEMVEGGPSF